MKDFIVIDLRGNSYAAALVSEIINALYLHGLVPKDNELKYYGLQSLVEDITRVDYWHMEEGEVE